MKRLNNQAGFTLVELSIVLVIIGLIVGGVLAGQDMIRAAEIRSTVSQLESYNTAVNTFRDKYRNLPGDMVGADAARFGFTVRNGAQGRGDGDRLLEPGVASGTATTGLYLGYETALFWRDLSLAALIGDGFSTATDALADTTTTPIGRYVPEAKIGLGHYVTVYSASGRNFFEITRIAGVAATGAYTLETGMSPQTAFNIDQKIDDGNPVNGIVLAAFSTAALDAVANAAGAPFVGAVPATPTSPAIALDCASGATLPVVAYSTATTAAANSPSCQLRIRSGF